MSGRSNTADGPAGMSGLRVGCLLAVLPAFWGCGPPPVVGCRYEAMVLVDGQPAAGVAVQLVSLADGPDQTGFFSAVTDQQGRFSVGGDRPLPPGDYRCAFFWPTGPALDADDRLMNRYRGSEGRQPVVQVGSDRKPDVFRLSTTAAATPNPVARSE